MPTTPSSDPINQVTLDLAEFEALRQQVVDLEAKVLEQQAHIESLEKILHDAEDPARQADYKAFRKKMGYD